MSRLPQLLANAKSEGWDGWVRTSADEQAVLAGYTFDLNAADRVKRFFRQFLCHSKGQWADEPFELLAWQWEQVIAPLFGWLRPDGTRRYRRGYIEVPKKNGKSTLFAGLSLYLLTGDQEAGAEIYSAAVDRDQASIVFHEAANMVENSPSLSQRLQVVRSTKRITFPRTQSFYRALSADVPAKEGLNAHAVLIDELHAQKTRDLWDTLRYAGASRRQPLHLSITTAGFDRHSICWEQHQYAQAILDGTAQDLSFFGYVSKHDIQPRSISFKGTLQTLEAFRPLIDFQSYRGQAFRLHLYQELLDAVVQHRVGDRPDRFEPRYKKRRSKRFIELKMPRHEFKRAVLKGLLKN